MGCYEVSASTFQPDLRHYHVKHEGQDVFLFFNAHPYKTIETEITLPIQRPFVGYDGLDNQLYSLNETSDDTETGLT